MHIPSLGMESLKTSFSSFHIQLCRRQRQPHPGRQTMLSIQRREPVRERHQLRRYIDCPLLV